MSTPTHQILLSIAAAIEADHRAQADKIRWCASHVAYLEQDAAATQRNSAHRYSAQLNATPKKRGA